MDFDTEGNLNSKLRWFVWEDLSLDPFQSNNLPREDCLFESRMGLICAYNGEGVISYALADVDDDDADKYYLALNTGGPCDLATKEGRFAWFEEYKPKEKTRSFVHKLMEECRTREDKINIQTDPVEIITTFSTVDVDEQDPIGTLYLTFCPKCGFTENRTLRAYRQVPFMSCSHCAHMFCIVEYVAKMKNLSIDAACDLIEKLSQ